MCAELKTLTVSLQAVCQKIIDCKMLDAGTASITLNYVLVCLSMSVTAYTCI